MKNNKLVTALLILIFPLLFTKAALANEAHRSALNTVLIERNIADIYGNNPPKLNDIHAMPLASEIEDSPTRPFADNELSQAVDNHSFEFVDEPNLGFFKQERTYNVDCDAAQSDPISDNETAIMLTAVEGPTVVSFDWRVSSERNFDGLAFTVLGINPDGGFFDTGIGTTITGQVDWNTRSVRIPAGPHLVAWGYIKDINTSVGDDTGWVDNVLIGPQGQVTPDLENPNACPGTLASIPAILQMLTADNLVIPEPPQLPDEPSPALPDSFDGQFYLRIESDSDDFVGGGIDYTYLQTNIFFGFEENSSESLFLFVTGFSEENPEDETSWRIELASNDRPLSVGVYENAERTPFHDINGLEVRLNQRNCSDLRGQFRIFEIEYNNAGNLTRLVADFERFCGDTTAGLRGSISYDASMESGQLQVVDPLPAGAQPMPEIPVDFEGQYFLRLESSGDSIINTDQPLTYLQSTAVFEIDTLSRNLLGDQFRNNLSISVNGVSSERPSIDDNWSLDLTVNNDTFRQGLYDNAQSDNFNELSFSGNGSGCSISDGQYRIFEIEFDSSNEIQKLVLDFEQTCGSTSGPIKGSFVYDKSKEPAFPVTMLPLPQDAEPAIEIPADFPGQYYLKVESEVGDNVGDGLEYTYFDNFSVLDFRSSNNNGIVIDIKGQSQERPGVEEDWRLTMETAAGNLLEAGVYPDATNNFIPIFNRLQFGSCFSDLVGEFRIFELERDNAGQITKLVADWEQTCGSSTGSLRGVLVFDASRDPVELALREDLPSGAALTPANSQNFQGTYSLVIESEDGEFVGSGEDYSYNESVATLRVFSGFNNSLTFNIDGGRVGRPDITNDRWSVSIQAPGQTLVPGSYRNATRFPFNSLNGLDFGGNGRGCNQSNGSFRVFEVSFDANQELESITMDFEQFCDSNSAALRGSLIYDSTR